MPHSKSQKIAVLDAGGQYCHLIARKLREIGVLAEVLPSSTPSRKLAGFKGLIISGGPASVYARTKPVIDPSILRLPMPVLGICYGHQFIAQALGGKVRPGKVAEYGVAELALITGDSLFRNIGATETVWMNHRDVVVEPPPDFDVLAKTMNCPVAAMKAKTGNLFGVQFHPEVAHTQRGFEILRNFALKICGCEPARWKPEEQLDKLVQAIVDKVKNRNVFFLVSGGVDSSVAFTLCVQALGPHRVEGLYVDTGLMRTIDIEDVEHLRQTTHAQIHIVDGSGTFFAALKGVNDPEEKRRRIGTTFVDIYEQYLKQRFNTEANKWILGQGTIYPDTIESGGTKYASRIKTHHNRVSVIEKLLRQGKVVEPLSQFYKDEVRRLGAQLRLEPRLVNKQPFPGPGLAVRFIIARSSGGLRDDSIVTDVASKVGLLGAKLDLRTVGVKGDERSYQGVAVLAGNLPEGNSGICLERASTEITNRSSRINRVVYFIDEMPLNPGEWRVRRWEMGRDRILLLREADALVRKVMTSRYQKVYKSIWQFPVILIPLVRDRTDHGTVVLRPVNSVDGMTASFCKLSADILHDLREELFRNLQVRVLYDVTNKPPATIEWE